MESIQSEDYKGYKIEIFQDENPESPREWDNLGKMVCFHNRYELGDKHNLKADYFESWADMEKQLKKSGAVVILPLYLYDHSGISMYIPGDGGYRQHEAWDSGQVGYIYATREDILKDYSVKTINKNLLVKVEEVLRAEVETYNQYLTGEVYGYVVSKPQTCNLGESHNTEEASCWGFYGLEDCLTEAKNSVDWKLGQPVTV